MNTKGVNIYTIKIIVYTIIGCAVDTLFLGGLFGICSLGAAYIASFVTTVDISIPKLFLSSFVAYWLISSSIAKFANEMERVVKWFDKNDKL